MVYLEDLRAEIGVAARLPRWVRSFRGPRTCRRGARATTRGGALHVRLRGHAEGRGPEPPQSARQPASARVRRGLQAARHRPQRAARVPQLRPDGRTAAAAAGGRADVPLPVAAPLPDGAGAGLWHQRHDPVRHGYVPGRLRPRGRQLRLLLGALRVRRRRARQGRDAARLVREVRHPDSRRVRRHRNRAGAGGQHADALPGRHRRASAARHRRTASNRWQASTRAGGYSSRVPT